MTIPILAGLGNAFLIAALFPSSGFAALALFSGVFVSIYLLRNQIFKEMARAHGHDQNYSSEGFQWKEQDPYEPIRFGCVNCHFAHGKIQCPKCGSRLKKLL